MIKAKRDELLAPLAAVSGIIERRHTLPILSNVLVDGASESLSFLATDIEIQIAAKSGIGGGRDAKAFTVGARKLLDILRALPEDVDVNLQPQDKRLLVKAGGRPLRFQKPPAGGDGRGCGRGKKVTGVQTCALPIFLATDIEIQIAAKSGIGGGRDAKAFTVGARKLLDILRALPEDVDVNLQPQDKRLLVKAGRSRFSLQTLPAEDFPRLARSSGDTARFALPQKVLRRQLGLVHYAMAQQDIRYYLNGLLMVVDGGELRLVATDGHRLAFASLPLETSMPRQEAIVPRKTVLELTKLLADSDDEVRIELSATQAAFSFGAIELVSKLVDGKFPDYTRVIPTQHKNSMQIQSDPLRQALQRAAILSNEKFRGVRWVLGDASLKIVSSNAEQEEAQEELEVGYNGDALDIGFNVNYLLDVLNNVAGAELECAFGDASSSALISYASEQGFKYVVMPMRI